MFLSLLDLLKISYVYPPEYTLPEIPGDIDVDAIVKDIDGRSVPYISSRTSQARLFGSCNGTSV